MNTDGRQTRICPRIPPWVKTPRLKQPFVSICVQEPAPSEVEGWFPPWFSRRIMRLAFYTYSYTDRLEMPIEPALHSIAETGYDGIDISGTNGKSADPESVTTELRQLTRRTADQLGLRIEAIITHATLADSLFTDTPLDLAGSADLAVDAGAPLVVFHMGGPVDDESKRQEAWIRVVSYLKDSLTYAESKDVRLAVDGVWKDWLVETPESFLRLHDEVGSPSFGVNFDPCYLMLRGYDPAEVAHQWKD
jgi:sugar phosphate isomerase/epimerase